MSHKNLEFISDLEDLNPPNVKEGCWSIQILIQCQSKYTQPPPTAASMTIAIETFHTLFQQIQVLIGAVKNHCSLFFSTYLSKLTYIHYINPDSCSITCF